MAKNKVETYIGFCIKAGKLTRGSGAIDTLKKGVELLLMDGDSAENSRRLALKFKNRFGCPLMIIHGDFGRVVNKDGCKLAAVRDKSLADAIVGSADETHVLVTADDL